MLSFCAFLAPFAFKNRHDRHAHRDTLESSLEEDDTASITFPYFTTATQNGLKKKNRPKKRQKVETVQC